MAARSLPVVALLLLFVDGISGQTTCSNGIVQCVTWFNNKYAAASSGGVIYYSSTTLSQMCTDFTTVENCLNNVLPTCPSDTQTIWNGIEDGYNTLCSSSGQSFYLQHQSCYESASLLSDVSQCNRTLFSAINGAISVSQICTAVDNYLYCCQSALANRCGNDAANWQIDLIKKMLGPTYSQLGCSIYISDLPSDGTGSGSSSPTVRATVLLPSVVTLLAAIIRETAVAN